MKRLLVFIPISFLLFAASSCSRPAAESAVPAPVSVQPADETRLDDVPAPDVPPPAVAKAPAGELPRAVAVVRPSAPPPPSSGSPTILTPPLPQPPLPPPSAEPAPDVAVLPDLPDLPKTPPPPTTRQVTIPSGTPVALRMIDSVSSDDAHVGQTFRASLDGPVVVDGEAVIPSGAKAAVKLVYVQSAGELKGKSELRLQLDSISVGSRSYSIQSDTFYREGEAQGARTARSAGIGAAVGAIIGGIAGGKKGAIIGAGTGAGSGAVIEAARDEQVRIDSESRVDFQLDAPLEITLPALDSSIERSIVRSGPARLGSRRDVDAPNISGEWIFTLHDPRGRREGRLLFEQNGTTLRGTIVDDTTDGKLQGSIGGDSIRFTTETEVRGRIVRMEYTGAIEADRLTGTATASLASGGRAEAPMRWSAERVK